MASFYSRYATYIKPLTETQLAAILRNKTVRSYSPYIFSLITIMILVVFAIRPTVSTILNLQKEIENKQQTLKLLTTKAQSLTLAKANYELLGQTTQVRINQAVPVNPDLASLIKSIQSTLPSNEASSSSLQIQPVLLTPTALLSNHPKLGEINFSFTVRGTYAQALGVINRLTKAQRVISIAGLSMNKQIDGPLILTVTGKGYYLK